MIIRLIIFLFLLPAFFYSQETVSSNFKVDSIFTNPAFKTAKLYIIGELYTFPENREINSLFLKQLHKNNIFPKYILLEEGHGKAFILNKYFETGDEKYLRAYAFVNDDEWKYLKKLRDYYFTLEEKNRFTFVGVDYDFNYDLACAAVKCILLNDSAFTKGSETYSSDDDGFEYLIQRLKFIGDPTTWGREHLREDLDLLCDLFNSNDSVKIINKAGTKIKELRLIRDCYLFSKNRKKGGPLLQIEGRENNMKRDSFIASNIYTLFLEDTSAVVLGQFGCFLVQEGIHSDNKASKRHTPMAELLNSNLGYIMTNKKVYTSTIIYDVRLRLECKYTGLDYLTVKKEYENLNTNQLYFYRIPNAKAEINLVLYKNKKSK